MYVHHLFMRRFLTMVAVGMMAACAYAQYHDDEDDVAGPIKPLEGVEYKAEMQLSASHGKTPLWLNANKYGLSSLDEFNGYLRGAVERPLSVDDGRKWGLGYGLDVAVPVNYTSHFVVQQAYVEGRWHHGALTIGAKEYPMELKNNSLSSGAQTLGRNARPVPQVRLALRDYWALPIFHRWVQIKGHIAYGRMTDDNWQHDFTHRQSKYADDVLYHSKAGYLRIGNEERFCPWSIEVGLEMASTFGGTAYQEQNGKMVAIPGRTGLSSYWKAFLPGGGETVEEGTVYQNAEGNIVGSWVARFNYDANNWTLGIYADKYFEDHSSMLFLDYDGYGTGSEWDTKKETKFFVYDPVDWLLGIEWHKKRDSWLQTIVLEYLYSKYQSGPIYHDHSQGWSEHISGKDDFYNHYIYTGWQHWGQAIGNPLYRSPIYNDDGTISFENNRFVGFHLGLDGTPKENLTYRFLGTYQWGFGTYDNPFYKKHHNASFLLEGKYHIESRRQWINNTTVTLGYGMDFGAILGGTNYGIQLTIAKSGLIK